MNIGMIILSTYILVVLGLAYYVSRSEKEDISSFTTASGSLGIFVLTLTLSATYHSSYAFLGAPGFSYSHGIGWWVNGIWTLFPGILFWYIGRRFWYLGRKEGYLSMAQYISHVYEDQYLGFLVTLITLIFSLPYVAIQAIGSGYIFETLSGGSLSYEAGAIIFLGLMILIVWMGGMKGVALTDAAQGVFMWLGLFFGSYVILRKNFPSLALGFERAYAVVPEHFTLPGPKGLVTPADWISRWLVITLGMMMFPHIVLRFFSGKSLRVLKWSSIFSSLYLTSIYWFTPAIGIIGNVLRPNMELPDQIFLELLLEYTPLIFAALVISGALAASMTTGDSQLHAVGSMISTDIYKVYISKDASPRDQFKVAKLSILVLGLISIVIALIRPGMLGDLLAISNGGVAVLAPTVLGSLFWEKSSRKGALYSILLGEGVLVAFTFFLSPPLGFMPGFWGLLVASLIFFLVGSLDREKTRAAEIVPELNSFFN